MKLTSKFVNKASDWPLKRKKQSNPQFTNQFVNLINMNFAMNLQTSKQSSKHLGEKLSEIDCNLLEMPVLV